MSPELNHLRKILVANRGEIAVRCISTCRRLGLTTVAIYTEPDAVSQHVILADEKVLLRSPRGYIDGDEILGVCQQYSVDAVIPGYGFLSENTDFARDITAAGIVFIGPSAESIEVMGLKHEARKLAQSARVPVVPGTGLVASREEALQASNDLTYPVILKATGGGGGMGLRVCRSPEEVGDAFDFVQSRGTALFKNSGVFVEKYYPKSRHIEVQVFGNGTDAVHYGERECSIQRRHQKVIEECPSPFVAAHPELRTRLTACAVNLASSIGYKSAGTIEYLVDDETGQFFFLEMNTRLQVEHGITELCYGIDLVELMLLQAEYEKAGGSGIPIEQLRGLQKEGPSGTAIEVRLYAENPTKKFEPCPGVLQHVQWTRGDHVRIDTWVQTGQNITPNYDPLIAKLMVHGKDRASSINLMLQALVDSKIQGTATNQHFLKQVVDSPEFHKGYTLTSFLESFEYAPSGFEVLSAGAYTTVQDLPGRLEKGHGIPQSGPMDDVSSRISNLLVGNRPEMEVLEMTISGPEFLFHAPAIVAVCGAPIPFTVDGMDQPLWSRIVVNAGQKVEIGEVGEHGCRAYLAVKGGFPEIPFYLESKSTTPSLKLGGIQGRQLRTGDYIALSDETHAWAATASNYTLPESLRPDVFTKSVYVMPGPHDSDDIMLPSDREMIYSATWKVGHNSSRTGIRLIGPPPKWARKDGGAGGSHPSNIMDYGYPSPGGVNWTGDSPVVFAADSPGLGGFICSSTVVSAGLWQMGQLKPGDTFRLKTTTIDGAMELRKRKREYFEALERFIWGKEPIDAATPLNMNLPENVSEAILKRSSDVIYRQGGDTFILVEFGSRAANVVLTGRIRLITQQLQSLVVEGLVVDPGLCSINVRYDGNVISQAKLVSLLHEIETKTESTPLMKIPCRKIHLPILFDPPAIQEAVQRYMETLRPSAAYLPDNIAYIQKNNGFKTRQGVFDAITSSSFLVIAVGFLTGLPIIFPLNPTSRLVAQKYNPSRTSTPGGTIGLGGSLFAIYPIEQPGGYQLVAKTLPLWDTFGTRPGFAPSRPWICEPFDLISFHEVDFEAFTQLEKSFESGNYRFDIQESVFDLAQEHAAARAANSDPEVIAFRERQAEGIEAMKTLENKLYAEWTAAEKAREAERLEQLSALRTDNSAVEIVSPINANVWKVLVQEGDVLSENQVVAILEAMKMEIEVRVPAGKIGSVVTAVASEPGSIVSPGDAIVLAKKSCN